MPSSENKFKFNEIERQDVIFLFEKKNFFNYKINILFQLLNPSKLLFKSITSSKNSISQKSPIPGRNCRRNSEGEATNPRLHLRRLPDQSPGSTRHDEHTIIDDCWISPLFLLKSLLLSRYFPFSTWFLLFLSKLIFSNFLRFFRFFSIEILKQFLKKAC